MNVQIDGASATRPGALLQATLDTPQRHAGGGAVTFARFRSGDVLRSRSVSGAVLHATLDVPAPPARLWADWERDIAQQLHLMPGDVEPLPLARARARWPDHRLCVRRMAEWTASLGLGDLLGDCDMALMACRGARYHDDAAQYGGAAFCNLFLGRDRGLDLHFPGAGVRIPLVCGTAVVFDTAQPHAVVPRGRSDFDAADFASGLDRTEVFLTWELPVEDVRVGSALGITLDVAPPTGGPRTAATEACAPRSPSRPS